MRKLLLLVLISFSGINLKAQANLDSLYGVWQDKTQKDSTRTIAYKDYIWKGFLFSNPDTAFQLAESLVTFGQEKPFPFAEATAYNTQGVSFAIRGKNQQAVEYYTRALKINEETGNKSGISSSFNNIGYSYTKQGDYAKALDFYNRGLKIREELGDRKGIARLLNNIGIIYYDQGNYSKALGYYTRSLKILEEIGDKVGSSQALINVGNIYSQQNNYAKTLEYYNKSLLIDEENGNKRGIASSLNNIGIVYKKQGNTSKAMEYYTRSLKINEVIGDNERIAVLLKNIGHLYYEQGNTSEALEYYTRSLKIREEIGDKNGIAGSFNSIGGFYYKQGNYSKAIELCQQSLTLSEEIGILGNQHLACECLYKSYKALGEGNRALAYHEQMHVLDDSLNAKETAKSLQQMEFNNQVYADSIKRVKEEELAIYMEEQKVQEKKRKNRIQYNLVVMVVLLLAGIIAMMTKFSFHPKVASAIIFIFFILIFEFLLVAASPFIDSISDGEVGYKISINTILAIIIFGIHQISESRLKKLLIKKNN